MGHQSLAAVHPNRYGPHSQIGRSITISQCTRTPG